MSKIEDRNREYWIERIVDRDKAAKISEDKLLKELYNAYSDSYIAIQKELNDFYMRYATYNSLSYSDVVRKLKPTDMRQYNSKMNELKRLYKATKNEDLFIEMKRLGARGNITRLQALLDSIDVELIKNSYKAQIRIEEHLSDMYKRSYKEALEDVGMTNKVINNRAVKEALKYPWSGKNFSSRIWDLKKTTLNKFQDTITKGIIQGQSIQDMAENIKGLSTQTYKKDMEKWRIEKAYRYNAERLVRTETNFFMAKGHIDGYKESGIIEELQIDAYIDGRTCSVCKEKDETIVKINEVSYGDSVPPFHPSCRCTVVPVVDINEKTVYNKSNTNVGEFIKKDFEQISEYHKRCDDTLSRKWYKWHDENIPNLVDKGKAIESQSRQAHSLRNTYRTQARDLMNDQEKRAQLDVDRPNFTFEELIKSKMERKGMSKDEAIKDILNTAIKTNKEINKKLGLE